MLILRGLALARAINSGTALAGNEGCTTIMWGARVMLATGAISRMKLKLSTPARFGSDIAAGARPILDDELLAEAFRQPLTH